MSPTRTPDQGKYTEARSQMARRGEYPYRADIHRRLIEAAIEGRPIAYSELGTSRAWVGAYLFRIAHEEDAAGRPPLTSIVVHKTDGRPGSGLLQALHEIGYARRRETESEVWQRAMADVFRFWRGKSADTVLIGWHPVLSDQRDTWPRFRGASGSLPGAPTWLSRSVREVC
jgi:hypothetical protein